MVLKVSASLALLFLTVHLSNGQTERQWLCGTCRIMNHEIAKEIGATDEARTTTGGSYRIDPNGNRKTVEMKYKRSQLHIHEVMEKVCGHMTNYGRLISAPPGKTETKRTYHFVRTTTADGQFVDAVDRSAEVQNKLRHKCDDILEEYEEWLEDFFAKEVTSEAADRELCIMRAGYCKVEDLVESLYPPPIPNKKPEESKEQEEQLDQQEGPVKSEL